MDSVALQLLKTIMNELVQFADHEQKKDISHFVEGLTDTEIPHILASTRFKC